MYCKIKIFDKLVFVDPIFNFLKIQKECIDSDNYYKFVNFILLCNLVIITAIFVLNLFYKNVLKDVLYVIMIIDLFNYLFFLHKIKQKNTNLILKSNIYQIEISVLNFFEFLTKILVTIYFLHILTIYKNFPILIRDLFYIIVFIYVLFYFLFFFIQRYFYKCKISIVF